MQNFKVYEELSIGNSGAKIYRVRQHNSLIFYAAHEFNTYIAQIQNSAKHQIRILSKLSHPNIIKLQQYFQTTHLIIVITELCQPYSLARLVKKDRVLPLSSICLFAYDLKDALLYLHSNGFLHNDYCAQNFILSSNGILKLIEFESAGLVYKTYALTLQDIEFSIRKNGYLHRAPETLLEYGSYSYASDLFSMGCALYFLAFSRYPYYELDKGDYQEYARNVFQHGTEHLQYVIPPLDSRYYQLPQDFYELLFALLQPIPFERANWDTVCQNRIFSQQQEYLVFKAQHQQCYAAFLYKASSEGLFGPDKTNYQFDKRGNPVVYLQQQVYENAAKIKQVIDVQLKKIKDNATEEQAETPFEQTEPSYGPDMTIKYVKKQTYLRYLADYVSYQYDELNELVELYKQDAFIYRWMAGFTPILTGRNNIIKQQLLIVVDVYQGVIPAEDLSYRVLQKLQGEEYLCYLEVLLQRNSADKPFRFETEDDLIDLLNYIVYMMHCTFAIREKRQNDSKINPKLFVSEDVFERTLACLSALIFEYRTDFIKLFYYQQISAVFEILKFLLDNDLADKLLTGQTLLCEIMIFIFSLVMLGILSSNDVEQHVYQTVAQLHTSFVQSINTRLLEIDFLNASRKEVIQHLSKCIVYFTFCINISLQIIQIQNENNMKYELFKALSFTDYIIAAQNIFMFIHQDNFVSALKYKASTLTNRLMESCTFRSSQAFAVMTDLRLFSIIQFYLVIPSYFDFPKVLYDVPATRNILYALIYSLLIERFANLDLQYQQFRLSSQLYSRTEKFIADNYYRLLNLQQFPAYDDALLALVAAMVSVIFFTDSMVFKIFKNPLNAGNTKLYWFMNMADVRLEQKFDEMVQRCGIKCKNVFLNYCVGQLILFLQLFFNISLNAVKQVAIQGVYINHQHIGKCTHAIDLVARFCNYTCQYYALLFTKEQVYNLESIAFSIVNTMVASHPPEITPLTEYREIKNNFAFIDEDTYTYVYKIVTLLQLYLNYPWSYAINQHLFYYKDKQIKGLYYCILNLAKDPYQMCLVQETDESRALVKIMKLLHNESIQIFEASMQKFTRLGPILPYAAQSQQFVLYNGSYCAASDNLYIGMLGGYVFSEKDVQEATDLIKSVLARFIQSKTIFNASFVQIDKRTQAALRLAIQALELGIESQDLRDIAEKCLKQPYAIAKPAAEIVELYIAKDNEYWLRYMKNAQENALKPDIYLSIIRTCLVVLRKMCESSALNSSSAAADLVRKIKYPDLTELVTSCLESAIYFFTNTVFGQNQNIAVKLQLAALYFVLFLRFSSVDTELIQRTLEAFASSVDQNREFEERIYDFILDIMYYMSQILVEKGWQQFYAVCGQIGYRLTKQYQFRLEQIRMNSIPVQWPESWFE